MTMQAGAEAVFEGLMAAALRAVDPLAAVRAAARDPRLDAQQRALLSGIDENGLRMSALLVARLRFERLLQGSSRAGAWYEDDAPAFVEAFRRYHAEVPPRGWQPADEGRAFEAWLAQGVADGELAAPRV